MMRIKYRYKFLFVCACTAIFSFSTAHTTDNITLKTTARSKYKTSSSNNPSNTQATTSLSKLTTELPTTTIRPTTTTATINISGIFPVPNQLRVWMNNSLNRPTLTCNDTSKVIGVHSVVLGYLELNTHCTDDKFETCQAGNNIFCCCEQNLSNRQYRDILRQISSKTYVKYTVLPFQGANGKCNDGLARTNSNYSVVSYDCIEEAAIHTMCRASNGSSDTLYVYSDSYPDKVGIAGVCNCEITTLPQQTLVVQMYDNRIDIGQSLVLLDGNTTREKWQQNKTFNHIDTRTITSNGKLLRLNWRGGIIPAGAQKGQFWMRIKAADETPLTIHCFAPESPRYYRKFGDAIPATRMNRQCSIKGDLLPVTVQCDPRVAALHSVRNGFLNGAQCNEANGPWNSSTQSVNTCEQTVTKYRYLGNSSNPADKGVLQMFSGQPYVQKDFSRSSADGACNSHEADYAVVYYDCISGTSVQPMCTVSSRAGDTIYVWNEGYPGNGDMEIRTCDCAIKTTASQFYVQVYDNRLDCSQRLEFREANTTIMFLKRDDEFRHIDTYFVKTTGTQLTLHWKGINGTNKDRLGKFWIRIQATDKSNMSIECFDPVYPTTTTTTTTTTSGPSTTTSGQHNATAGPHTTTKPGRPDNSNSNGPSITTKNGTTDKQTESAATYCIPRYAVYAVGGGFGAILLVFIMGCVIMNRSKNAAKDKELFELEMNSTRGGSSYRDPAYSKAHRPSIESEKSNYGKFSRHPSEISMDEHKSSRRPREVPSRDNDRERRHHRDDNRKRRGHRDDDREGRSHRDDDGERRRYRDGDREKSNRRDDDRERRGRGKRHHHRHRDDYSQSENEKDESPRRRDSHDYERIIDTADSPGRKKEHRSRDHRDRRDKRSSEDKGESKGHMSEDGHKDERNCGDDKADKKAETSEQPEPPKEGTNKL